MNRQTHKHVTFVGKYKENQFFVDTTFGQKVSFSQLSGNAGISVLTKCADYDKLEFHVSCVVLYFIALKNKLHTHCWKHFS